MGIFKQKQYKYSLLSLLAVIAMTYSTTPVSAVTSTQSIAIPAYEYPTLTNLWPAIDSAGSQVPFVIVNPASGPGVSVNSDYAARIAANEAAGIRSIGYVDTNYQSRSMTAVMDDIDRWYSLYPDIDGVLLDRVSVGSGTDLCYSAYAYNYAKIKHVNDTVIQNFGTYTAPAYEPYGDIFINAEMDHTLYQSWTLPLDGFQNNPANSNRFWHLIHTTDVSDLSSTLVQTRNNNAGWVYITDDIMPNPYDAAPTYWNSELSSVGALPASSFPNRGITQLPAGCLDVTATTQATNGSDPTTATTITNASSTYSIPTPPVVSFALPTGVALKNASGSGWSCSGTSCTYASALAASTSAPTLSATFSASCQYQSGSIGIQTTVFPNATQTSTTAISQPEGCISANQTEGLAPTGMNSLGIITIAGALIVAGVITLRRLL